MDQIKYIGEHLWYGQLGHGLVVLAFVASLLSMVTYWLSYKHRNDEVTAASWIRLARNAYLIHVLSSLSIFFLLLSMMAQHLYEYHYVWFHVSDDLPMKYILSAFWEGQEGSFLLWILWHAVIGVVLMKTAGTWENLTMPVLCLVQAFLLTMILGVHIPWAGELHKFGSSPFVLLRDVTEAPIFSRPDYLEVVKGKGLNVLLQNYWMTIHPPTLFLGFALCTIPFAFAVAGLISGNHKSWLKAVQPWALASASLLGTGILMGAAWAYEALSFGGYWAWDPVENMSLVPWLVLIAGLHTNIIANSTGRAIKSTYWYYALTFVLILYSTFLTRSGVLGDTSAHAFTEMGLEMQLIIFLLTFLLGFTALFFTRSKSIPVVQKEEAISSREFWMFIGSIVLIFASILITFTTSIPAYNKLLDFFGGLFDKSMVSWHRSAPLDVIGHYNKFQMWTGSFIAVLSGFAFYLRYKETNFKSRAPKFFKYMGIFAGASTLITILASIGLNMYAWQFYVVLWSGVFTFIANATYFTIYLRKKPKMSGSVMAHMGFGLMLVGILISGLNKTYISTNPFTQRGMIADEDLGKNILLLKNAPMNMNGYIAEYKGDTIIQNNRTFHVAFTKINEDGSQGKNFDLYPNVVYERDFSKVSASNPSTLRTLGKDIYAHVASLPPEEINQEQAKAKADSLKYDDYKVSLGDTVYTKKNYIKASDIVFNPVHPEYKNEPGDIAIGVKLELGNLKKDTVYKAMPVMVLRNELLMSYPAQINDLATKIELNQDVFQPLFVRNNQHNTQFTVGKGEHFTVNGQDVTFEKFEKVDSKDSTITVSARLVNTAGDVIASPSLQIIGNQTRSDKVFIAGYSSFVALTRIDPESESAVIEVNKIGDISLNIPIKVAENSTRSDYIVLEAFVFPGINFFWIGTILMMVGLGVSSVYRWQSRKNSAA